MSSHVQPQGRQQPDHRYFVLKASNGQEVGRSQMYASAATMENGIASVNKNAAEAALVDTTLEA